MISTAKYQAQQVLQTHSMLQPQAHCGPILSGILGTAGSSHLSLVAAAQPVDNVTPIIDLNERQVLCVGGRTSGIPIYRKMIEDRGARFTHHDGGEEDRASRLVSLLQAADVVICQVNCISHAAYWRVKEHCKRSGKPCLFVEMSGRSALERALGQGASRDASALLAA